MIANLWQSTVFALAAALLTLAFRNHRAPTRYALWLAGIAQIPGSHPLLIAAAGDLVAEAMPPVASTSWAPMVHQLSEPFAAIPAEAARPFPSPSPSRLPNLLFVVWLCGTAANLLVWARQGIASAPRSAPPRRYQSTRPSR
jgi:hypothetical protein